MKLILVILVLVPGFYASMEHLSYTSYRVRRQETEDDDLEGSGDGVNTKSTHVDEEPDKPEGGDEPILPPLPEPDPTTEKEEPPTPPPLPSEGDQPVIPVTPEPTTTTTPAPVPVPTVMVTQATSTSLPTTQPPSIVDVKENEIGAATSDSDFSVDGEGGLTTVTPSPPNPEDMTSPNVTTVVQTSEREKVPVLSSPAIDPLLGSGQESELAAGGEGKRSSEGWSLLPVDDLSLLIFILLCLILIVVLLVCCFILQHMTAWAIIKIDPRNMSRTYRNVCPVESDVQEEGMAKYTIEAGEDEKEGSVQLLSLSKLPQSAGIHTFTLEQKRGQGFLHRSTAEVILSTSPEGAKTQTLPIRIATFGHQNYLDPGDMTTNPPRPTSDTWLKEILEKIENEDAEPEDCKFDEIANLHREVKPIVPVHPNKSTTTFLQKFAVHTSMASKKTVRTVEERSVVQSPTVVNGTQKSKTVDELSCGENDELEDYLENRSFPV